MSLHYLVKYLCSKNRNSQEVIEANCHVRLVTQITVLIYLLFSSPTKRCSHQPYKNPIIDCTVHNCCNKETDVAANLPYMISSLSVSQSKMIRAVRKSRIHERRAYRGFRRVPWFLAISLRAPRPDESIVQGVPGRSLQCIIALFVVWLSYCPR